MANVNGVSSSSYSSIYGSRGANIISGLVSGLDTESMIENSVKGYQSKIQSLQNQQTSLTWKQDAIRSITDKLIALSTKYTSYTSTTNLASNGFFTKAVNTTTGGKYADKIAASGQTNSDIKINSVEQIATAAKYQVNVSDLGIYGVNPDKAEAVSAISGAATDVSDISGGLTLRIGNKSVALKFDENDIITGADDMAGKIKDKLFEAVQDMDGGKITIENKEYTAEELKNAVNVNVSDGEITFGTSGKLGGAAVYISGASGKLADNGGMVEVTNGALGSGSGSIKFSTDPDAKFSHKENSADRLSGKTVKVTLDGETAEIKLGDYTAGLEKGQELDDEQLKALKDNVLKDLQKGLQENFGSKVTVSFQTMTDKEGNSFEGLSFQVGEKSGSSLKVTSEAGETLGIGKTGVTNSLNTSKTLGDLVGTKEIELADGSKKTGLEGAKLLYAEGDVKTKNGKLVDSAGNTVVELKEKDADGNTQYARVDKDGNLIHAMEINGKKVGAFTTDTALESVFTAINNSDAGVKVNYSQLTNQLTFTATKTGSQSRIDFEDGLSQKLFGGAELNKAPNGILLDDDLNPVTGTDSEGKTYYVKQMNDGSYVRATEKGKPVTVDGHTVQVDPSDPVVKKARKGYSAGQDAIVNVSVNGENKKLVRSSNVIDMDGMTVTVKGTFNEGYEYSNGNATVYAKDDAGNFILDESGNRTKVKMQDSSQVTFTTSTDADTVVDAIKSFVTDVNAIMNEVHSAYTTTPMKDSSGNKYEPLSNDDKDGMSDKELETYENNAKTGILFGDSDVSRLYSALRSAINSSGLDVGDMRDIGLTTTYKDGVTTLNLNEDRLRSALASDPDKVRQVFTKTVEGGYGTNGLMYNIKSVTDKYASTSIGNYGVLVKKAGTKTKTLSLNDNALQKQIDRYQKQIENWQVKMSDKIDYYTTQFTRLEQLMNEMNSQSSALSGLMGG